MMEYFLLQSSVTVPFRPIMFDQTAVPYTMTEENYRKLPDSNSFYYHIKEDEEIPELLVKPTFLCGEELKHIMEVYDPTVRWKSIYIMPDQEEQVVEGTRHYWIPDLMKQKCVHKDCRIMPNGSIEHLILDQQRLRNLDLFQVDGLVENKVVVSLQLAESISRRHMYGVSLERVEVR